MIKSPNSWHIIKRVPPPPPPPPDSLDSTDILKREPVTKSSKVKHILLGWKEVNSGDPRATARERKDARDAGQEDDRRASRRARRSSP